MTVIINNINFKLKDFDSFTPSNPLVLHIINDSVDEIIEAIGDSASISIPNEFAGEGYSLDSIKRFKRANVYVCEVVFKKIAIEQLIDEHSKTLIDQSGDIQSMIPAIEEIASLAAENSEVVTSQNEDIEAISKAIEELTEIIGQITTTNTEVVDNMEEE